MKRESLGILTTSIFLLLMGIIGCRSQSGTDNGEKEARDQESIEIQPRVRISHETITQPRSYDVASKVTDNDISPEDKSCSQDSDCVVIPIDGCLPCGDGAGQAAVNKSAAREIMGPKKDECLPQIQKLMKSKQQPTHTESEECKFNGAKCVNGACALANLTQEELKELMPKHHQGHGDRPQASDHGRGGEDMGRSHAGGPMGTRSQPSEQFGLDNRTRDPRAGFGGSPSPFGASVGGDRFGFGQGPARLGQGDLGRRAFEANDPRTMSARHQIPANPNYGENGLHRSAFGKASY